MTIADLPPATFALQSGNAPATAVAQSSEPFSSFLEINTEDAQPVQPDVTTAKQPETSAPGASWDQLFSFASFFFAAPNPSSADEIDAEAGSITGDGSAQETEPEPVEPATEETAGSERGAALPLPVAAAAAQQPVNTAGFGWSLPAEQRGEQAGAKAVEPEPAPQVEEVAAGTNAEASQPAAELAFAVRVKASDAQANTSEPAPKPETRTAHAAFGRPRIAEVQPAQGQQVDSGSSNSAGGNSAGEHSTPLHKQGASQEETPRLEHVVAGMPEPAAAAVPAAPQTQNHLSSNETRTKELPSQPVEMPELRPEQAQGPRDVSVRIGGAGDSSVDVRIMERGGELRVAVRSEHTDLRDTLRAELPDLRSRMDQHGFRTETWHPTQVAAMAETARSEQDFSGGARDQQQQSSREYQEQQHSRQPRPDWLEEIERQTAASA